MKNEREKKRKKTGGKLKEQIMLSRFYMFSFVQHEHGI